MAARDELGLMDLVTDSARVITSAECAFVFDPLVEPAGAASGAPIDRGRRERLVAAARSFAVATYRDGVVRLADVRTDPRCSQAAVDSDESFPLASYLAVPMVGRAPDVLGVLVLGHHQSARFGEEHERMVTGIAGPAALALENARLHRRLAESEAEAKLAYERVLQADRRKDEFLAMLSHELRNPLSPILNAAHLLKLRGQRSREVDVIERQATHMSRLIEDLLDVSRIGRGSLRIQDEIVAIADVVANAVEMVGPLIEQRHHHLTVSVGDDDLSVRGDRTRLAQVVSNMLTNAARYSRDGGHIELVASVLDDWIAIRVSDDGIGIEPELLATVFEPFVRGSADRVRAERGIGIGLTLVRSLVELHGGTVTASSAGTGCGSTFTVRLPRG